MSTVLDASALLAFLHEEPGGDQVAPHLEGSHVSAVNWSEVLQKSLQRGVSIDDMLQDFADIGVIFEPFTVHQADLAARLFTHTRNHGLSLADRVCLSLAMEKRLPVMTADRAWGSLGLAVEIRMIR
ncbi:PIN domain-containing protein [Acidithiobacillus sp. IBUN Pt1247-S3]|uniref:PIN domain-containing protein n=1 Tax=Acidithiobacillus sp. IBUN Pt1247-S3 TaxID=3166642 RepID=UPI0034E50AE3